MQVLKWGTFIHVGLTAPWTGQHECQPMWTKAACLCFRNPECVPHSGQMNKKVQTMWFFSRHQRTTSWRPHVGRSMKPLTVPCFR